VASTARGRFSGARLVKLMAAAGLDDTALAARIGRKEATVRKWRIGWSKPSFEDGMAVADELGVHPKELLVPAQAGARNP
jgi:transcriptional regulator with XRE-family HTH domain